MYTMVLRHPYKYHVFFCLSIANLSTTAAKSSRGQFEVAGLKINKLIVEISQLQDVASVAEDCGAHQKPFIHNAPPPPNITKCPGSD